MRSCIPLFIVFCVFGGSVPLFGEETPAGKEPVASPASLEAYLNDQAEFERRVRAFDKLNVLVAHAKYIQAKKLEEQKDLEGAKALSNEAQALLLQVKAAYEKGLSHFEKSPILHNYYGEFAHDFMGEPAEAAAHWEKAIEQDGNFGRAHCNLGMFLLHSGKYDEGYAHVRKAVELEPDNTDFLFNMIQVYLTHFVQIMQINKWDRLRVYEEAMKLSERTVELGPKDFELLRDHALNFFLAADFGAKPNWERAAKAWQAAREHARTDVERFNAWLNEARVHIRAGNDKKARNCLEKANELSPNNSVVQTLMEEVKK